MTTQKATDSSRKTVRARRGGPGSLGEQVAKWKKLASNTRLLSSSGATPQMATDLALFEEMIAKVEGSMAEQDILSGRATILVKQRALDVASTRLVRNRVVAHVQAWLGPENEQLREFGLKPRQQKPRARLPQPEAPQEPAEPGQAAPDEPGT